MISSEEAFNRTNKERVNTSFEYLLKYIELAILNSTDLGLYNTFYSLELFTEDQVKILKRMLEEKGYKVTTDSKNIYIDWNNEI